MGDFQCRLFIKYLFVEVLVTSFHTFYVKASPLDEPFNLLGNTYITTRLNVVKYPELYSIFLVSLYRTGRPPKKHKTSFFCLKLCELPIRPNTLVWIWEHFYWRMEQGYFGCLPRNGKCFENFQKGGWKHEVFLNFPNLVPGSFEFAAEISEIFGFISRAISDPFYSLSSLPVWKWPLALDN